MMRVSISDRYAKPIGKRKGETKTRIEDIC